MNELRPIHVPNEAPRVIEHFYPEIQHANVLDALAENCGIQWGQKRSIAEAIAAAFRKQLETAPRAEYESLLYRVTEVWREAKIDLETQLSEARQKIAGLETESSEAKQDPPPPDESEPILEEAPPAAPEQETNTNEKSV